tara:strand:+ start:681 stop:1337 length:657 start_codon:yes stop_codon:yes gene_type:complete
MSKKRRYNEIVSNIIGEPKKIVLLGDGCIGKSTFFQKMDKLTDENYRFSKKYKATDNFDFKRINIKTSIGTVIVDLWDTAGQESRGGMLRDAYLKGADGVLLLYDLSEQRTKDNIQKWLEQIKKVSPNVPVAVLGNKCDKFKDLQQTKAVKIRECNLENWYGSKTIKNFLISIKEDTHIKFTSPLWFGNENISEEDGCLIGLEYVLKSLFKEEISIEY